MARRLLVRLGLGIALTSLLVGGFASTTAAQPSTCELVAPWELSEATGAAFGQGEPSGSSCTWHTETRDGHVLTITLDVATQPPSVSIETDDVSIDSDPASQAIAALVADRIASGDTAPMESPTAVGAGERPDLCQLFSAEVVETMLGVKVKPYGSLGDHACGYLADEPGRVGVDLLVEFESGSLADIPTDWPDAIEARWQDFQRWPTAGMSGAAEPRT